MFGACYALYHITAHSDAIVALFAFNKCHALTTLAKTKARDPTADILRYIKQQHQQSGTPPPSQPTSAEKQIQAATSPPATPRPSATPSISYRCSLRLFPSNLPSLNSKPRSPPYPPSSLLTLPGSFLLTKVCQRSSWMFKKDK